MSLVNVHVGYVFSAWTRWGMTIKQIRWHNQRLVRELQK